MTKQDAEVQAVETEKAEIVKDQKNGVTRPTAGTATGRVWKICDTIYANATEENPITRARVIKTAEAEDINVSTAATQYGRWRKYMGLERETPKAVVAAEGEKPKCNKKSTPKADKVAAGAAVVEESPAPTTDTPATAMDAALGEGEDLA